MTRNLPLPPLTDSDSRYVSEPIPRCGCGAEAVAVAPGHAGETTDLFHLTRGVPAQGWCAACWPWRPKEPA